MYLRPTNEMAKIKTHITQLLLTNVTFVILLMWRCAAACS